MRLGRPKYVSDVKISREQAPSHLNQLRTQAVCR